MRTITFYSYKGGVGRTLALSNIAKRLGEFKKKVFIIDFDLEAPGVHFKFKDFIRPDQIKTGLVDYIYEFSQNGNIDNDLDKYVQKFQIGFGESGSISLMCAGNNYSTEYWRKLSSINWNDLFYKKGSQGIEFFLDLKHKIEKKFRPDYLLIDSRTGFTETSAITMSILADEVAIFAANNIENLEGSKQIIKSIKRTKSISTEKIKTHFILTRIPYGNAAKDKEIRAKIIIDAKNQLNIGCDPNNKLVNEIHIIHTDRDLEIKETLKIGTEIEKKEVSISNDYFSLMKVLCGFSVEELNKYHKLFESDEQFFNALSLRGESFVEGMKKALNSNQSHVGALKNLCDYFHRNLRLDEAIIYGQKLQNLEPYNVSNITFLGASYLYRYLFKKDKKDLDESLRILESGVELNKTSINASVLNHSVYILALDKEGKYTLNEITDMYLDLLTKYPNSPFIYNSLAVHYNEIGEIKKAYDIIYKALEIDGDGLYITTLAEIYANDNKMNDFYYNIENAIKANYRINGFFYYSEFYHKYFNDERFLNIMHKYNLIEKFNELHQRYKTLTKKN